MNEESIFKQAVGLTDPRARSYFLDRACAGDVALRQRMDDRLAAYPIAGGSGSEPSGLDTTQSYDSRVAGVGERVGVYQLIERLGEGGMGEVWLADQTAPVKRRVALKMIKPGMDSQAVLARFEAERQALALMDHPQNRWRRVADLRSGGSVNRVVFRPRTRRRGPEISRATRELTFQPRPTDDRIKRK